MNLAYGQAKTGGAGADNWAFDTDLGIQTDFQTPSTAVAKVPAKGAVSTINTVVAGSGYPLGISKTLIQSATDGTGQGFSCTANIIEAAGIMKVSSSVKNTAAFNLYQNNLLVAFDPENTDPYTYARITATGQAFSGTSTAIAGTSATGINGTFIVTVVSGSVTAVSVSAVGSLYKVGDVVTITKATLEGAPAFGGGNIFQGDLTLLLTEENVTGGIDASSVRVFDGGVGHVIGDVITLTEENTPGGTGTLTILTLGTGNTVITAPNNRYPKAVIVGDPAATVAASQTIEFVGLDDVNVIIGGFVNGRIFPFQFKQIVDAGSDVTLGLTTILY